jgi:hypothetical protein
MESFSLQLVCGKANLRSEKCHQINGLLSVYRSEAIYLPGHICARCEMSNLANIYTVFIFKMFRVLCLSSALSLLRNTAILYVL